MRVDQAAGGTNRPDIPADVFAMSPGRRMRYYLPAPAMIVILLDAGPLSVRFRNADVPAVARASIWGPSSHAFRTTTQGGISVGIGLTAEGWTRLAARSALPFRDRVAPLPRVVPPAAVAELVGSLDALADDADIASVLDRLLPALFAPAPEEAPQLRALGHLILADGGCGVGEMARRLDLDMRALRRLASDHFGMPAKSLLLRARFIRSFSRWMLNGEPASYEGIDTSYFDVSHFLQDSAKYLGTTPRRFAKFELDYMRASLRARAAVIGAAQHTLHAAPDHE